MPSPLAQRPFPSCVSCMLRATQRSVFKATALHTIVLLENAMPPEILQTALNPESPALGSLIEGPSIQHDMSSYKTRFRKTINIGARDGSASLIITTRHFPQKSTYIHSQTPNFARVLTDPHSHGHFVTLNLIVHLGMQHDYHPSASPNQAKNPDALAHRPCHAN